MKRLKRATYLAAAAFMLVGPATAQIAGVRHPGVRAWQMFSQVGVGVLRGAFVERRGSEELRRLTPLELHGLTTYPAVEHYRYGWRILLPGDLDRFAAEHCASLGPGVSLGFEGAVGSKRGWIPARVDRICEGAE